MVVTFHGLDFCKFQLGSLVIAVNPPAKDSSYKSSRFGADIVLSSIRHQDYSGGDMLSGGEKEPFIIDGPGEYEVGGIYIQGFQSTSEYGGSKKINTIYYFTLDDISVCFLGPLSDTQLDSKVLEAIDDIDILCAPVGGEGVLSPHESYELAVKLEPHIIIPTHFTDSADPNLKTFLKEEGSEKQKETEKLTVKQKDVLGYEGNVMVLTPQS